MELLAHTNVLIAGVPADRPVVADRTVVAIVADAAIVVATIQLLRTKPQRVEKRSGHVDESKPAEKMVLLS
jgi:hypothetical protein